LATDKEKITDVIGEITFSRSFSFLATERDSGVFHQIEIALRSASWLGQVPWLYWLHDYLSPIIGNHLGITARHGAIRDLALSEVTSRKERGSDRNDILSKLFRVHDEKPKQLDEMGVVSMATSNIAAGSDTTAISTRAIIYYLLKNPSTLQKLREEVDQRRKEGKLSDLVKLNEADDMPYLQAVMYEALRLHPAVGMALPRVVPEGGCEIDGVFLPAGVSHNKSAIESYSMLKISTTDVSGSESMGGSSKQRSIWRGRRSIPSGTLAEG
jgi:hypothetical protein